MNQAALALPVSEPIVTVEPRRISVLAIEIGILGILLCLIQIADGVMTGIGVMHYGTSIEGNFMLRALMQQYGVVTALVGVKLFALAIIFTLCWLSFTVGWLRTALKGVISLYFVAAILPWAYILFASRL